MPQEFEYDFEDLMLEIGRNRVPYSGTATLTECDPDEYPGEFYVSDVEGFDKPSHSGHQTVSQSMWQLVVEALQRCPHANAWFADAIAEGAPVNPNREHSTLNHAQTGVAA